MTLAASFEALLPRLETPRLVLRAPRPADFDAFAAYQASDRSRFTGGPMDRLSAWRAFGHTAGHWVLRGYGVLVLERRDTGAAVGTAGPWFPEGWPEPEIAWTLWDAAAEGQGLATEAALAARAWAYEALGWTTAISMILNGNTRSEALARKLGCTRESGFRHAQFGPASVWRHPAPDTQGAGMEAYS
ncbi:MAG: GNAT family N-acetyltransferase [Rhodobacteraceae bacterium]|nr:GNAT family N-acetyltransferase [Paracoccaceae bacterium]